MNTSIKIIMIYAENISLTVLDFKIPSSKYYTTMS